MSDRIVENDFGRLATLALGLELQLSFETAIGDVSPRDILEF